MADPQVTDIATPQSKDAPQFVAPRSYLQPRNPPRTFKNLSAANPLDREQLEALVRYAPIRLYTGANFLSSIREPSVPF